jgi:hypothetical protein
MEFNQKGVLYQVARSYIEEEAPEKRDEFDLVFPSVYETINLHSTHSKADQQLQSNGALGFIPEICNDSVIPLVCWVGKTFLLAVATVELKILLPKVLNATHKRLCSMGCKPRLVKKIRDRIELYFKELLP